MRQGQERCQRYCLTPKWPLEPFLSLLIPKRIWLGYQQAELQDTDGMRTGNCSYPQVCKGMRLSPANQQFRVHNSNASWDHRETSSLV